MNAYTNHNAAADALRAIIARGVAAYQESLPDFARDAEPLVALPYSARSLDELPDPEPIITLGEEAQRRLCLNCSLADCVGVESSACPIRIEQRRVWPVADEWRRADEFP